MCYQTDLNIESWQSLEVKTIRHRCFLDNACSINKMSISIFVALLESVHVVDSIATRSIFCLDLYEDNGSKWLHDVD